MSVYYKYTHTYWFMCSEPEGCTEGSVRLSGGDIEQEGIAEVCVSGIWGSICGEGFTSTAGQVFCRQLGYHDNGITLFCTRTDYGLLHILIQIFSYFCFQKFQQFMTTLTLEMEKVPLFGIT